MLYEADKIINDRFKLLRQIGRGSFGEVWLAEDIELGFQLAVKIYVALDQRGLNEFKNEFKNVRHLNHPNLLRPDYYDHCGNSPYLVMAYCPETVGEKVGSMSEQEVWELIKDVSAGLEYLHKQDIIHRDIKPDNILKNDQGVYVISDFGLSQQMRSTLRRASRRNNASQDSLSGSIGYMAPEMFTATPTAVKATDIWALGVTIYECVTGQLPFCGQGGVMELHGAELPELPSGYGATLSDLIRRCLAKDAWNRPTAKEINEIAHSVSPDPDEDASINARLSKEEKERCDLEMIKQLKKERSDLEKLNQKYAHVISELRQSEDNVSAIITKLQNSRRNFKTAFWIVFAFLALTVFLGILTISGMAEICQNEIEEKQEELNRANNVIHTIDKICKDSHLGNNQTFSDWTSSNHAQSSKSVKKYSFSGCNGDVLRFDYDVDSETYDHFRAKIIYDGDTITIKDVSGEGNRGTFLYKLTNTGSFVLLLEYNKDNSVDRGRDNVRVSNIFLESSAIDKIERALPHRHYSPPLINEEVSAIAEQDTVSAIAEQDTAVVVEAAEQVPDI